MYSATEQQWQRLLAWGWFPFIGLTHADRTDLLALAKFDRYMSPILEQFCRNFCQDLKGRMECWGRHDFLAQQSSFLTLAASHFRKADYVSCISVLYPRIEGVMRSLFAEENPSAEAQADSRSIVTNLVENQLAHSVLLPNRFEMYLRRVYFRGFNLSRGDTALSRNSHAHGVSNIGDYDLIRAAVGFMIIDQVSYYLND